ncbi:MAG: NmrA family NAD(P)-binding protein [Candidatus Obscuribacterales bacterium]|nr:NmrA family NAD(P)-binding protein [Candidatus Obscuribacterales bacterium]
MSGKNVFLVGATGMLGGEIVKALVSQGKHRIRALVRDTNKESAIELKSHGVELVLGDGSDISALGDQMKGFDLVISALGNDPSTFVKVHSNLIEAANRAGVSRLIPSDFSVDFFKISESENFNLAMRKEVAKLFESKEVRPIHILNGAFMDTLLDRHVPFIDWGKKVVPFYGDPMQKCDFTSIEDTAKFVAAICEEDNTPETVRIAGDVLSMPEFASSISEGLQERFTAESRGSLKDLENLIESRKKTAVNPFEWIAWQYHHNMVSGRAKMDPLDNMRYSQVQPLRAKDFARLHGNTAKGLGRST